jgi:pentatricopeptide repeat domain-containing protein 1
MLDACVKCDNMNKAAEIFEEIKASSTLNPDLITFSTLIKGFCKVKNIERANQFFQMILTHKIQPDEALINLILECCYGTGNTDKGVEIFNTMTNLKIPASNITYSIMIKVNHLYFTHISSFIAKPGKFTRLCQSLI